MYYCVTCDYYTIRLMPRCEKCRDLTLAISMAPKHIFRWLDAQ